MKHRIFLFLFACVSMLSLVLTSCSDDSVDVNEINKQTILIFMPWSGSQSSVGLYNELKANLDSIESAIVDEKGMNGRVLVFLSSSSQSSSLYEITYENGKIEHHTIKEYTGNEYDTTQGMLQILNDVQANAYALNYAMIIGGHGSGWTFKEDWNDYPNNAKAYGAVGAKGNKAVADGVLPLYPQTRFFGSVSDMNYAFNITDLADAIQQAGMKMQYILFDDCYMANIETAYMLKDATNYLIASTSEVMAMGMPYRELWSNLAKSTPGYEAIINSFHTFYSNYKVYYDRNTKYIIPGGALSAIDCRNLEQLATVMKEINSHYTLADSLRDSVQVLDGFNNHIFYDMGSYVDHVCNNANLKSDFHAALDNVVKYKQSTDSVFTNLYHSPYSIPVKTFSGITISDMSLNSVALKGREKTAWWRRTH